jgi:hypothetical protein
MAAGIFRELGLGGRKILRANDLACWPPSGQMDSDGQGFDPTDKIRTQEFVRTSRLNPNDAFG